MIFEATGPFNAIGRIAMAEVEAALSAGWRVSVVAHRLAESLQGRVEWLQLYNPPRGFSVKWLTARHFIKKAMGDPERFDLIHGHQPQIADLCDIFECHYLTRAAMEQGCRDARRGWRGRIARLQEAIVLRAEDRCYRSWNQETVLLCDSELTLRTFDNLYGLPRTHDVQIYPAPPWNPPSEAERVAARKNLVGTWEGPVVGFLGGMNERKGYKTALSAAAGSAGVFLLMGGSHSEQIDPPASLAGRYRGLGLIEDVDRFYAAIDLLLVPSVFEPFGLVCFEAVSRGVPVAASESVGALDTLSPYGITQRLSKDSDLAEMTLGFIRDRDETQLQCQACVDAYSAEQFADRVLRRYQSVLTTKYGDSKPSPLPADVSLAAKHANPTA
jgi:glycosyltransferase involved in cell wall biosynthesis